VCEGDHITLYVSLWAENVAHGDSYMVSLKYGTQTHLVGLVNSDGGVGSTTFRASNGFGRHTVYADAQNVGLKYGASVQPQPSGSADLPPEPRSSCCNAQTLASWTLCDSGACDPPSGCAGPSSADLSPYQESGLLGTSAYQRHWRLRETGFGTTITQGVVDADGTLNGLPTTYNEPQCYAAYISLQVGCEFAADGTITWP
jgi:hypothetical protein